MPIDRRRGLVRTHYCAQDRRAISSRKCVRPSTQRQLSSFVATSCLGLFHHFLLAVQRLRCHSISDSDSSTSDKSVLCFLCNRALVTCLRWLLLPSVTLSGLMVQHRGGCAVTRTSFQKTHVLLYLGTRLWLAKFLNLVLLILWC